ncbi:hypothetical protein PanWU01x14_330480 [Parasponia andersonii]|uniref:Transmembrane protein n=1 Tax=Parasponia andersonii TaxID=3476 RepID=A0A2P5AHY5_PARAD|nr:hypothetical protein PanWU01x14_330480 [Parasponia andersonii]
MLERIIFIILLKVLSGFMCFVDRLRFDMFWFRSMKKLFGGRLHVRVYTIQVVIIFFCPPIWWKDMLPFLLSMDFYSCFELRKPQPAFK